MAINKTALLINMLLMCLIIFIPSVHAAYSQFQSTVFKSQTMVDGVALTIEYNISFEQITPSQHAKIMSFYTQYSGYNSHTIASQNTEATVVHYVSSAPVELLLNNFSKTAEYLGMQVLVRGDNATISIRFIKLNPKSLPYKQW